ncbi:alpha/beta fold hydrolase [Saccharothrix violaceirubra]|uniref:3-oxoadipate enol-lactonase n=1 Tax=Saccharothrix violaceirubra TaxID=413306 RepID=A0A7W7T4E0_9PSEU|nr:alpha/beta fold hydrolase [Saccharothrix violaceirubra]MBB4965100.1 3-oxoadipate enol-lactonase [Saccharothrix violaceirubra]
MPSDRVPVDRGEIAYRLQGQGPPLVLLSTLSGTWVRQVPVLRRHFTLLTYDLRGFGDSPSADGFPDNAGHADDLARLLDALGFPTAAVVGLSHGGLVAQHFAGRHGDRLSGLGLVSTIAAPRRSTVLFLRMLKGFLDRDDVAGFWEVLRSFLFSAANFDKLLAREGALREAMFNQYTAGALLSIYGQALTHDATGWLGGVDCPTLVVGGREDMLFPPWQTEELAALVPGSKLVLLPAAHVPPVEVPADFNHLVVDFFGGAP